MTSKTRPPTCRRCSSKGRNAAPGSARPGQNLHARLDGMGVAVTLLHHSQVNPLSAPFWYRMGYARCGQLGGRPANALR